MDKKGQVRDCVAVYPPQAYLAIMLILKAQKDENILTFSMLYFAKAADAISTASCCISSLISAFLITAFRCSVIVKVVKYGMGVD